MRAVRSLVVFSLASLGAACAEDGPDDDSGGVQIVTTANTGTRPAAPTTPPAPSPPATAPDPPTSGSSPPVSSTAEPSTSAAPVPPAPDPNVEPVVATEVAGEFDQPVDLAVRPGDPALYVVEQPGRIIRADATGRTPVLDVSDLTEASGERGLLGLAFHPTQPRAYVNYTTADAGDTVIAEYAVAPDGAFDAETARTVLTLDQPYPNHNGGGLAFGPDGLLYIGTGDGGSGGDPERRASDPFDLLGKLLRIDPAGDPYTVPADNPFAVGAAADGAGAPEVWSIGLRNPWRFAFDAPTGDLWIADVGQNELEEVNRVTRAGGYPAGYAADFGWSAYEGTERFNDDVPEPADHAAPVLTYPHDLGCSVSGGFVYRGTAVAGLAGWYLYSDYCSGTLWAFDVANARNVVLAEDLGPVTAVRQGPDGEAYVLIHDGPVRRIVPG